MLVSCCLVHVSASRDSEVDFLPTRISEHGLIPAEVRALSMHDQLRDLAYKIVREEGRNATQHTRLLGVDAEEAVEGRVRAQLCKLLQHV